MSILLSDIAGKARLIHWIKDTASQFILPFVTIAQRATVQRHIEKMEAHEGPYEVKAEVAQSADGRSMRLIISIYPGRSQ